MSKTDGIGVLSLSLDFLHVRRWVDASHKGASANPVVCVAVNFDDPHPITSSIVELPSGEVSKRDAIGETELWHGLRLTSLADILHVELRGSPTGPTIASCSAPVTSLLEDAFLESDTNGVKAEFNLDAEGDETLGNGRPLDTAPASFAKGDDAVSHTAGVAHTQFRVKYHRQIDILRALCDGVGIDVASVDSMKEYAPQAVSVVKGADGLVKARRNSLGRDGQTQSPSDSPTKVTAFDVKGTCCISQSPPPCFTTQY